MRQVYDQIKINLPLGMRERIKERAREHRRSLTAEVVLALEEKFPASEPGSGDGDQAVESSPVTKTHTAVEAAGSSING